MNRQERDVSLLRRAQTGDDQALAELYDEYTPLLYPVVLRILRSAPDAEDALQDAWLQVWKRAASYDAGRGTVAAWLLTVARNRQSDLRRSAAERYAERLDDVADTRVSTLVADLDPDAIPDRRLALLFVCGYAVGRLTRYHAWGTGLAMVLLGSGLVAMTMALGG